MRVPCRTRNSERYDLIVDFPPIVSQQAITDRIKFIQSSVHDSTPMIINLPIYRFQDILKDIKRKEYVFAINCQKSFLGNTEIIHKDEGDEGLYESVKMFIGEITGDCIIVNDDYTRPLMFQLIAKMFEAARVVEEGVATKENIGRLLFNDVARDIDYFGLDNLLKVAEYCFPIYGEPFSSPELLKEMVKEGKLGVASKGGFYSYEKKHA